MQKEQQAALELMEGCPLVGTTMVGVPWRGRAQGRGVLRISAPHWVVSLALTIIAVDLFQKKEFRDVDY